MSENNNNNNNDNKDFFSNKRVLSKPKNVEADNDIRLDKTKPIEVVIELMKNPIQYGKGYIKIIILPDRTIILNTLPDNFLENFIKVPINNVDSIELDRLIMVYLYKAMRTFDSKSSAKTNLHEGMITALLYHSEVRILNNYFIELGKGAGDKYNQIIINASHRITEDQKVLPNQKAFEIPKRMTWQWTIFDSNFGSLVENYLSNLIVPSSIKISIEKNGVELDYQSPQRVFQLDTFEESWSLGNYYSKFQVAEDSLGEVKMYWKLPAHNNEIAYNLIPNHSLDGLGVTGSVVFTDTDQFANTQRIEVRDTVLSSIRSKIQSLVQEHKEEIEIKRIIKDHYVDIKESQINFLKSVLKVKEDKLKDTIYNYSRFDKETILENGTLFSYTIQTILDSIGEKYPSVRFFKPSNSSLSIEDIDDFQKDLKLLDVDFRKLFPNALLGNLFSSGMFMGMIKLGDIYQQIYAMSDMNNLPNLKNVSRSKLVLFPLSPYYDYLIPMDLMKKLEDSDYEEKDDDKTTINIPKTNLDKLKKHGVGKIPAQVLAEEQKRLEEERLEREEDYKKTPQPEKVPQIDTVKPTQPSDSNYKITSEDKQEPSQQEPSQSINQQNGSNNSNVSEVPTEIPSQSNVDDGDDQNNRYDIDEDEDEEDNEEIEEKELEIVSYKDHDYELDYLEYVREGQSGEIPILRSNHEEPKFITYQKYFAWQNTLRILMEEASKRYYLANEIVLPVLYYEKSSVHGFCTNNRVIALNTEKWFAGNKQALANWLIMIASHELAHTRFMIHSEEMYSLAENITFMAFREKMTIIDDQGKMVEKYISQVIRDLL